MRVSTTVPASLARLGIGGVSDNLAAHQEIGGITADFVRIFRPEIEVQMLGWKDARPAAAKDGKS